MSNSSVLKSSFFQYLVAHNRPHLDNFKKWIFQPGMRFNSLEKWWGDQGARSVPHEGLDLCSFEDLDGDKRTLHPHTKIPATFAGEIVKIERDFLGESIYLRHEIYDSRARQLYSAYGHTAPKDSLKIGSWVAGGEILATLSNRSGTKLTILPHVHITFAWIPGQISLNRLTWDNLGTVRGIELIDPLLLLDS